MACYGGPGMFLPLRDKAAPRATAWTCGVLILLNVVAFVLELRGGTAWVTRLALTPQQLTSSPAGPALVTLVTHMFLHGGLLHLVGNMWFLHVFGGPAEARLGHGGFLFTYLLSGLGGALLHVVAQPHSPVPLVGASGAISGVMGAFLWEMGGSRMGLLMLFWRVEVRAWWFVLAWVASQTYDAFGSLSSSGKGEGVAFWAHVGGFVVGLCATAVKGRR